MAAIQAGWNNYPPAIESEFVTEFKITAEREQVFNPPLPRPVRAELESWEGIEQVLLAPTSSRSPLIDFDESLADPEWVNQSDEWRKELVYGFTNLRVMEDLGLFELPEGPLEEVAVAPKWMAERMGLFVGRELQFDTGDEVAQATIAVISDRLSLPYQLSMLLLDESHPNFEPVEPQGILFNVQEDFYDKTIEPWRSCSDNIHRFDGNRRQRSSMKMKFFIINGRPCYTQSLLY